MTWHNLSANQVLAEVKSTAVGLTAAVAAQRLTANGPNELKAAKRISALHILAGQFKGLIVWILIAAGTVSLALNEVGDAVAIFAIVLLNAIIGFYQELSAEKSIAALMKMTAPQAKVRRDDQVISVAAAELVTGDILELEAGDLIAADARILRAASLKCIESALTGESEAVAKKPDVMPEGDVPLGDRENIVFQGTSVTAGAASAVVFATGMQTELGGIAKLLDDAGADQETPLQKKLDAFGRVLLYAASGVVALLFLLGWLRGVPMLELFLTSISLAVAAIPEGLPSVVTVALSVGVVRLARRGALARKLAAVETLGSTDVICTDKTGTLTVGEMTARALYVGGHGYEVNGEGYSPAGEVLFEGSKAGEPHTAPLLELATVVLGCNNANVVEEDGVWKTVGDPTEGALLVAGGKAGGDRARIDAAMPKQYEIPFDSDRKRSSTIRKMPDGKLRAFVNGAPASVLDCCTRLYTWDGVRPLLEEDRKQILAQTSDMAKRALRVLGSACGESPTGETAETVERELVFVGLTGIYDPPRPEAKSAITKCHDAGIRVVMITGDHPHTAAAIAVELGIASKDVVAVTGVELDAMSADDLKGRVASIDVYARVTAEHKLRIVRALKAGGAAVAMTGDGVNDAPALKGADIGIAMGKTGTEVTKQAADMVITDDNFATIVAAVEEGRGIYNNIRKTLQYLLAGNTGELLLMTACVAAGMPSPLLPIHLLWINLVTDGFPALCLATDPVDPDVMKQKPRPRSESITDHRFLRTMFFTGFLTAAVAFAVYVHALRTESVEVARGAAFAVLVFAELWRAFGARSEVKPIWHISLLTNVYLVVVVALSIGIQVLSQHNAILGGFLKTPFMPYTDFLALLALGAIPLVVLELAKVVKKRQ
jgi:P-type Ca2+ transporter type 2C